MYIEEFIILTMKQSFAALAWLIAMSVYGQSDWDPSFGVSLGTNLSHTSSVFDESIALNLTEVDNNKLGLAAGVFCKWNEAKKTFLFTEMNYTQKGSHPPDEGLRGPVRLKLDYLALCQSIVYNPINVLGVFAGVEASFLLSSTTVFLDNNFDDREYVELLQFWGENGFDYRRLDMGVKAGMLFDPANSNVSFSLRYTHGLMAVLPLEITFADEVGSFVHSGNNKIFLNRALSLKIHYTFNQSNLRTHS